MLLNEYSVLNEDPVLNEDLLGKPHKVLSRLRFFEVIRPVSFVCHVIRVWAKPSLTVSLQGASHERRCVTRFDRARAEGPEP
jgi:hypothetical protein